MLGELFGCRKSCLLCPDKVEHEFPRRGRVAQWTRDFRVYTILYRKSDCPRTPYVQYPFAFLIASLPLSSSGFYPIHVLYVRPSRFRFKRFLMRPPKTARGQQMIYGRTRSSVISHYDIAL